MRSNAGWMIAAALAAVSNPCAAAESLLWLVRDGQACSVIVAASEDKFAANRLQKWLSEKTGVEVDVSVGDNRSAPAQHCLVLVGSAASNPPLRRLSEQIGLSPGLASLSDQGYVARRVRREGRDHVILAGGGRDGAIHAVVDLLNWRLNHSGRDVWLESLNDRREPRFPYRWLWTWDNRMDWGGSGDPVTRMGGGSYDKASEAFLIDFKRCVDYMADHKFNGLIIWGFLRDTHGGVEAAQELCRYATERGVRILPGVGTSGYAGYYYEGNHPLNAQTWLTEHPDLRSIDKDGKPRMAPCPSHQANQDWLDRGAKWLFDNFQLGGVNLEMGDFFVCYCDSCKHARAEIPSDEPDYYKDMAISHMVTLKTMRRLAPEAWLSYATYTGYSADMAKSPPKFLSMIPEDAICQWTLTRMTPRWPTNVEPMAKHNLGYLHWCNSSTHTEDDFYLERVQSICRQAAAAGFEGLDTYGELPDSRPNAELFYLAWEAFLWDPEMSIEEFVEQRLARLYGGQDAARLLPEIISLVRTSSQRKDVENCAKAVALAESARRTASPDGHARWDRLIEQLHGHERAARQAIEGQRRRETEARQGEKISVASVEASDEETVKKWFASKAVDGNVDEPEGYWLTQATSPQQAWIEVSLAKPSKINRVILFHQLNARHYRSLDYNISVRADGQWKSVVTVENNPLAGWVVHPFEPVVTDAVRLEITRSAYSARMGVGEIGLRLADKD